MKNKKVRVEFHVHTTTSACYCLTNEQILEKTKKNKTNYLIITDHNSIEGALRCRDFLEKSESKTKVIIGEEVATQDGEIIGFFLQNKIQKGMSAKETVEEILKQKGLVAIPHPFDRLRHKAINKNIEKVLEFRPLIEIFNARVIFPWENEKAKQFSEKHNLPVLVGSDAHLESELGNTFMEMEDFSGPRDFLEKIKKADFHTKRNFPLNIVKSLIHKMTASKN